MTMYSRSDLVRRLKVRIGRPTTDEAFTVTTTDDVYDDKLSEAQDHLIQKLGLYSPEAIWTVPTLLTSSDSGYTYGFGTDTDSAAIFAFGHFLVFENKNSMPGYPLTVGVDYTIEGTVIRIPNNVPRTFADGPYAQYAAPSNVIDVTHEPVVPKIARLALLSEAEARCWQHLGLDSAGAEADAERDWQTVLAVLRTQGSGKGGAPLSRRPRYRRYGY